jgi:hypothetical protein
VALGVFCPGTTSSLIPVYCLVGRGRHVGPFRFPSPISRIPAKGMGGFISFGSRALAAAETWSELNPGLTPPADGMLSPVMARLLFCISKVSGHSKLDAFKYFFVKPPLNCPNFRATCTHTTQKA